MTRFRRSLILIITAQAICLIVGLWINQRLINAFTANAVLSQNSAIDNDPFNSNADQQTEHTNNSESQAGVVEQQSQENSGSAILAANVFTFIWVVAIEGVFAFFILNRIESDSDTESERHYHDSLTKTRDLLQTRDAIIFGLAQLAESRDTDTGEHLERIALYSTRLASAVRYDRRFHSRVSPSFVRLIGISSALHDIGKVSVADSVLLKPGPLSESERVDMQDHAQRGADCIKKIETRLGQCNFLEMAREIASSHHEKWDSSGYPAGLRGVEIPLSARIVAIADVYDALRSRRAYKPEMSHEAAVEIIESESGKQFDPALVEIFSKIQFQFYEISVAFSKETQPAETPQLQNV